MRSVRIRLAEPRAPARPHGIAAMRAFTTASLLALWTLQPGAQPAPPVSPPPVRTFEYDANGNPTRTVRVGSASGLATSHGYDTLNRLVSTTDARGAVTLRGYAGSDDIRTVLDPVLARTDYERDGLGQLATLRSADSGTAAHSYDAAGLLLTRTDARGMLSAFSHDALGRMTRVVHSGGPAVSQVFNWGYDETFSGTSFGVGRLSSMNGPATYAQFAYDIHGRLVQQFQRSVVASSAFGLGSGPPSVVDHVTGHGYDAAGRVVQLNLPSGRIVRYVRAGGLVQSVSVAAGAAATAQPLVSAVRWEPFGAAVAGWLWHLNSGTSAHDRIHDSSGRVVRYTLGPQLRDMRYDVHDRITGYAHYARATGAPVATLDQSFAHDQVDRLINSSGTGSAIAVSYDTNGNRSAISVDGSSGSYGIAPNSNRMSLAPLPLRTFNHDASGNRSGPIPSGPLSSENTTTVYFDAAGRMSNWLRGSTKLAQYDYDAMGRRVIKIATVSNRATVTAGPPSLYRTVFVYDTESRLIGEYDGGSGAAIREYVWLENTPLAMLMPNPADPSGEPLVFHLHADHLETTRVITDKSGVVRWSWLAEPWGTSGPNENPAGAGALLFNLRFPGQYFDTESGLHYNFHRYYDPGTGRYTQSDPIGLAGGVNTYAYVGGNPISYTDPMGLAYFAARPLQGLPWLGPLSNNPLDNWTNTSIAHEQLFFEDGKLPGNVGFFGDSVRKSENSPSGYRRLPGQYNDCVMRMAAQAASTGKYNLATNNCQSWADRVREQYDKLMKSGLGAAACGL